MIVDKIAAPRNGTVVNDDGEEQLDVYIEVSLILRPPQFHHYYHQHHSDTRTQHQQFCKICCDCWLGLVSK